MKTQILKWLKEKDGYLSGQELCDLLGVSRTAVWKVIKQLQQEGYQIEAVRNKGYCLTRVADVMTESELKTRMGESWLGKNLEYHDMIDSTNIRAKKLAEEGAEDGTLVIADIQSAGRGRRGRGWDAPGGVGIWMSLLLRPSIAPSSASMLTLVAALAVAKGIQEAAGLKPEIKWPNDIVIAGKKVCGILTEMSAELEGIHYVVIGIGINVNIIDFPEELKERATSLYLQSGEQVNRGQVIAAVMQAFEVYYENFLETGNLSGLLCEYEERLANKNQEVRVLAASDSYEGICLGIDKTGELLVKRKDETIQHVVSGEVSVRGIYGYV